jgi:hypothetical protein
MSVRPIEYSVCLVKEIKEPLTTNINLAKLYNVIDNKVAKAEPKIPIGMKIIFKPTVKTPK